MAINKKSLFVLVSIVLTLVITFATVLSVAALTNDEATYGTDMNTPTTSNINTDNILAQKIIFPKTKCSEKHDIVSHLLL